MEKLDDAIDDSDVLREAGAGALGWATTVGFGVR